ncbi:hypothetical protein [Thalassotalea sp. SU-HH00458]|uniref:relaxase/mobilization nuclease domain-containing protein n=1 Tax=Thalassotalea sp. SU-HH00458 TaxID=3127657 RepID=UPI003106E4D7
MIHKVTPRRPTIAPLLKYMLRNGHGHEHDLNLVTWISSTTFVQDPIERDKYGLPITKQPEEPLNELIKEFEEQSTLHKGKAENLYAHYVISQHPDDRRLTQSEWYELIADYLQALGYDNTCKHAFIEHSEKSHNHAHIASSVVKSDGSIVDNTNDVLKGFDVLRKYEKKFGLKQLSSPERNWGKHYSKGELKAAGGSREEAMSKDWAARIRARFKAIEIENGGKLPDTMSKLVLALAKKGVAVKARQNEQGEITGISYKADDGPWISGSKVKASRLTFQNLQSNENVSYVPERDNPALLGNNDLKVNVAVQITKAQYKHIKVLKPRLRVFRRNKKQYASFTFYNSKKQREFAELMDAILELLRLLFDSNYGIDDDELLFYFSLEENFEYEYINQGISTYDVSDSVDALDNLLVEHKRWIGNFNHCETTHSLSWTHESTENELCVN